MTFLKIELSQFMTVILKTKVTVPNTSKWKKSVYNFTCWETIQKVNIFFCDEYKKKSSEKSLVNNRGNVSIIRVSLVIHTLLRNIQTHTVNCINIFFFTRRIQGSLTYARNSDAFIVEIYMFLRILTNLIQFSLKNWISMEISLIYTQIQKQILISTYFITWGKENHRLDSKQILWKI